MPSALIEGFAETWTRLAGGRWDAVDVGVGRLVRWHAPGGGVEALPDRMYGLAGVAVGEVNGDSLGGGCAINLPPGVRSAGAELHCLGHHLVAADRAEAWSRLRRVGRQGVAKAERMGCRVDHDAEDGAWFGLSSMKSAALGGRPPHPGLIRTLRDVFGPDAVGLTVARADDQPAACVLWLVVDGYGMLVDGASDRAHWDRNPNNLAVWAAVSAAIDRGARRVDYGFSPVGAGDARFKDHMGGREIPLYRLRARGPLSAPPA
ncbi:MAG: GNAT family N-acetyltransferase [Myxococcota bacterium]